jgi:hypothetical protein
VELRGACGVVVVWCGGVAVRRRRGGAAGAARCGAVRGGVVVRCGGVAWRWCGGAVRRVWCSVVWCVGGVVVRCGVECGVVWCLCCSNTGQALNLTDLT